MALRAQVFGDGKGFIEALGLEDYADAAAYGGRFAGDVVAGHFGAAAGGRHHGGEDAEEGRLAAAIGP